MSQAPLTAVLRHLHRLAGAPNADLTDTTLLEGFVQHRDRAALEELVRRHGPLP